MAAKTSKQSTTAEAKQPIDGEASITHENIIKNLEPLSQVLQSTVKNLWRIFVLRYVAKAVGELVAVAFITFVSIWLLGTKTNWLLIPAALDALLLFDASQLLINPHYHAMEDIIERIRQERKANPDVTIYTNR